MCKIVREGRWEDNRIVALFDTALAPIWVSRILVGLKEEPILALKFFKWAERRIGFRHTTESYCLLAHILFCSRMYIDAHDILKDLITSTRVFPGCDIFDVLWSTRNVCIPGYGVFDTFFSVLVELGMLEEASECFLRMKSFKVRPKVRSCNYLLQRLSKTGNGEQSKKFFNDMVAAGVAASVFTYNIMIDYMCKEGDVKTARILFQQMKGMGVYARHCYL
ncbi:tetratricopeptide repeat (TPR)-like superfamily protein [Actinidia rufa]|uniref:Tetratricopeptide repeat (TPR)-like superfamily protein n=1 Tax=Actinidia rufa TaxID=165716 RepID=A0A7J0FPJ5_9ERIC|nr:tetratricopeptide repeat (TPR)-like superfamily protein [Actinidia rufa]